MSLSIWTHLLGALFLTVGSASGVSNCTPELERMMKKLIEGISQEVAISVVVIVCLLLLVTLRPRFLFRFLLNRGRAVNLVPMWESGPVNECFVCFDLISLRVMFPCGHQFCGSCVVRALEERPYLIEPLRCFLCRQDCTMLFLMITDEEYQEDINGDLGQTRAQLIEVVNIYNERHTPGPQRFVRVIIDSPALISHLWRELFTPHGIGLIYRMRVIGCVFIACLYLVIPVDLIPESVFGIVGIIDDLFIVLVILFYITSVYREFIAHREIV